MPRLAAKLSICTVSSHAHRAPRGRACPGPLRRVPNGNGRGVRQARLARDGPGGRRPEVQVRRLASRRRRARPNYDSRAGSSRRKRPLVLPGVRAEDALVIAPRASVRSRAARSAAELAHVKGEHRHDRSTQASPRRQSRGRRSSRRAARRVRLPLATPRRRGRRAGARLLALRAPPGQDRVPVPLPQRRRGGNLRPRGPRNAAHRR